MSSDDTHATNDTDANVAGSMDTGTDTPLFDATAQALAAAQTVHGVTSATGVTSGSEDTSPVDTNPQGVHAGGTVGCASEPANGGDAAENDWVEQGYGHPTKSTPVMDPDTHEGAAILELFRQIKDIETSNGRWPAGDVADQLTAWFTELGIDADERPRDAERRLRLALRDGVGGRPAASVYGVRIGTDHDDPDLIVRTALHVLARQLGPGTSIDLISHDRHVLARLEHQPTPTASS